MSAARLIGLVALLCALTMAYLFQRDLSLRLVTRETRQEAVMRVLSERRDRLTVEVASLTGYSRLDSVCSRAGQSASGRDGAGSRVVSTGVGPGIVDAPPAVAAVTPGDGR